MRVAAPRADTQAQAGSAIGVLIDELADLDVLSMTRPRPEEIGRTVSMRRATLGLTQTRLALLAGLSRTTISQLEAGTIVELGPEALTQLLDLLGLSDHAEHPGSPSRGLQLVSQSSSVSYRRTLTPNVLATVLASGELPPKWLPHIATMLDEAPLKFIVAAVDEAARAHGVPAKRIWQHLLRWARELKSPRPVWA